MTDQTLLIKIKADTDKATQEIRKLNTQVDKLSKTTKRTAGQSSQINTLSKSFSGLATSLAGVVTAYSAFSGAKQIITTTAAIEKGFIGVAKTTGLTRKELDLLEDSILDMSTTMGGVTIEELQGVAETAGQLGITGVSNIEEFTRVITMMGTATDLTAEQAATSMAQLGNSLGVPVVQFENMGSAINELSNNSTALAGDIVQISSRLGSMGRTFGLTASEVLALSTTLKDVGVSAELGSTALSKLMTEMLANTKEFAEASGKDFKEFSQILKDEPIEAIKLFLAELGKLDKTGRIKLLDDLKLKSSGARQTMLALADGTDLLTKHLKTSNIAWEENIGLQEEFNTAQSGLDAQWKKVDNALKGLQYKIGKRLLPDMKELSNETSSWLSSITDAQIDESASRIKKIGDAIKYVNDHLIPDDIFGEGAGFVDTFAKHIVGLGDAFSGTTKEAEKTKEKIKEVAEEVKNVENKEVEIKVKPDTTNFIEILEEGVYGPAERRTIEPDVKPNTDNVFQIIDAKTNEVEATLSFDPEVNPDTQNVISIIDEKTKEVERTINIEPKVKPDTGDMKKDVDKEAQAAEKSASIEVPAEVNKEKLIKDVQDGAKKAEDSTEVAIEPKPEMGLWETALQKVEKIIYPEVNFKPETQATDAARANIAKPIIVPVTYLPTNTPPSVSRAEGGLVPQRLATGGTFTGSGKVPGYDITDSDKVNAKLTGGEYVIKRSAVDAYGSSLLSAINNKQLQIPKFADGGSVGGTSKSMGDLGTLNINMGGNNFQVLASTAVAEAMQKWINEEGGL